MINVCKSVSDPETTGADRIDPDLQAMANKNAVKGERLLSRRQDAMARLTELPLGFDIHAWNGA